MRDMIPPLILFVTALLIYTGHRINYTYLNYVCIFGYPGLRFCGRAFSSCGKWELLFLSILPLRWCLLLQSTGSRAQTQASHTQA